MQTNKLLDHEKHLREWAKARNSFTTTYTPYWLTHHLATSGVAIAGRRWRHRFKGQRADEEAHSKAPRLADIAFDLGNPYGG